MAQSGPGIDCPGEWFIGSANTTSLVLGQERAIVIDNTTSPPTVTINGTTVNPGGEVWEYASAPTTTIRPNPARTGVPVSANFLVENPIAGASTEGGSRRMMFIANVGADEGAFRAGRVTGTQWDAVNRGTYSAAFGFNNTASGNRCFAAGDSNTASGAQSTVFALNNTASGDRSFAAGSNNTASGAQSAVINVDNTASGDNSFAAGSTNIASGNQSFAAGANNTVSGTASAALGASLALCSASTSAICGGDQNQIVSPVTLAFIGGGHLNQITASTRGAIVGGTTNTVSGQQGAILGGATNSVSSTNGAVAGGSSNVASGQQGAILGGSSNTASATNSVVVGGSASTASGQNSAVVGGTASTASGVGGANVGGNVLINAGNGAAIVGGGLNQVTAGGTNSVVLGGNNSIASGSSSIVGGVSANNNSKNNTFLWSDATGHTIDAGAVANTVWWATGTGAGALDPVYTIYTNAARTTGMQMFGGGAAWVAISDVNRKEHLEELRYADVLAKVESLPIFQFNYKGTPADALYRGPTAQDWHARFPSGKYPLGIDTLDLDGITLAALKGLAHLTRAQAARLEAQGARLAELESRLDAAAPLP